MLTPLTAQAIRVHLKTIPDWSQRAHTIGRTYKFTDFLQSLDFVNRVAKKAQKLNHHPDMDIRYDHVKLTLTSHDAGGLTEKDFTLAGQCDAVFAKFSAA
jgi:4a-hydroxytetrahydrobiopterin dehydratase